MFLWFRHRQTHEFRGIRILYHSEELKWFFLLLELRCKSYRTHLRVQVYTGGLCRTVRYSPNLRSHARSYGINYKGVSQ